MNGIVAVETGVQNLNVCRRRRQNEPQKREMMDKYQLVLENWGRVKGQILQLKGTVKSPQGYIVIYS